MDSIDELLNFVAGLIANITDQIRIGAQNAITGVTSWIRDAVSGIAAGITSLVNNIVPIVSKVIGEVVTAIQQFFGPFLASIQGIVSTVSASLSEILAEVRNTFAGIFDQIAQVTVNVLSTIHDFITSAAASFTALAESVIDAVHGFIQRTVDAISAVFNAGITAIQDIARTVIQTIVDGATAVVLAAIGAYNDVKAIIVADYEELLTGAKAIISTVEERLSDVKQAFKDAADALVGELHKLDEATLGKIRDGVKAVVDFTTIPEVDLASVALVESMREIANGKWDATTMEKWVESDWFQISNLPPSIRSILLALVQAGAIVGILAQASETQAARYKQQLALEKPWEVLSPGDVSAAYRRRLIEFEPAKTTIRKSGFSEDDARILLDNAQESPAEDVLLALWLRGDVSNERLNQIMFQRGYDQEWVDHFKTLAFEIPPLDDIIRMGRRLVFDPEIVSQFKLDDDFQQPVADWAAKKGLSTEWVHRYWQAHWDLPSVNQGFEMLQRGVIDRASLDLLFRDSGMAPGWRDKLLQIAYSPLSRVDIRRMNKLGLLDEAGVKDAYMQIGYDSVNAERLTQFTIKANTAKPLPDFGALGKTSVSSILSFLADGVLTQPEAIDLLVKTGKTNEAAQAFVFDEVLKMERKNRADEVAHILTLVKGGLLETAAATDQLHKLNLTTPELDKATTQLLRIQQQSVTLPTQAQGASMLKAGVISEQDYKDLLTTHGYAPKWVAAFVALAKGSNADDSLKG